MAFGFARALSSGEEPRRAYEAAVGTVLSITEPGRLDGGSESWVQRFELVNPLDTTSAHDAPLARTPSGRLPAGVPQLLPSEETLAEATRARDAKLQRVQGARHRNRPCDTQSPRNDIILTLSWSVFVCYLSGSRSTRSANSSLQNIPIALADWLDTVHAVCHQYAAAANGSTGAPWLG